MGRLMAEWIVEGQPAFDVWHMDSRRFGGHYASREYTLARTVEVYSTYYDIKYPGQERLAGRPLRVSPAYPRLQELGAVWGEKSGWERANWFEPNAAAGDESLRPRGWAGRDLVAGDRGRAPWRAVRRAALFDETSFAKIEVEGPGAEAFLQRLCANDVGRSARHGDLHADAERARRDRVRRHRDEARRGSLSHRDRDGVRPPRPFLDPCARAGGRFGAGSGRDQRARVLRHLGAASREILQPLTTADLSNDAFPVSARPRAGGRAGPVSGRAGDLRRRAGMGAVLPGRVRAAAVGHALGGRAAARAGGRRVPRDRLAAAREGLPRMGFGYRRPT